MPRISCASRAFKPTVRVVHGDARSTGLPDKHYHACVTSPPYFGLREYGDDDREIGDESTPDEYVSEMVAVGREVRRVLRDDGTWWLNLGDSYASDTKGSGGTSSTTIGGGRCQATNAGSLHGPYKLKCGVPPKSLLGIPWRVALALQADGWILRAAIPWIKANPMPESVRDRPTVAHEYVFLLAKQARYFWDADAVRCQALQPSGSPIATGQHKRSALQSMQASTLGTNQGSAGRNIRTSDFFHAGIDAIEDFAEHARDIRENGGLLLSPDGEPLAFLVNPAGSKLAHFAMWPPRLVAPMIKASTSEKGCCQTCGAPWTRVVERTKFGQKSLQTKASDDSALRNDGDRNLGGRQFAKFKSENPDVDLGFRPSCSCPPADPVPCRVVDIFAGSGTTAQVARALGRDCDLVELMAKNLPIIEQRLRDELDPETMKPVKR